MFRILIILILTFPLFGQNGWTGWSGWRDFDPAVSTGPDTTFGPELFANDQFTNWTSDNPDNWTYTGAAEAPGDTVTENPTGVCQFIASGSQNVQIDQNIGLVQGETYKLTIKIDSFTGRFQYGQVGGPFITLVAASVGTGVKSFTYTPTGANPSFRFKRENLQAVNIKMDWVSIRKIESIN
jgi:hypothetical protein